MAQEWNAPADTAVNEPVGMLEIWPVELSPQQTTAPAWPMAQVCAPPAESAVSPLCAGVASAAPLREIDVAEAADVPAAVVAAARTLPATSVASNAWTNLVAACTVPPTTL